MNFPKRSQRPSARAAAERAKREWVDPVLARQLVDLMGDGALPVLRRMAHSSPEDAVRIYEKAITETRA